MASFVDVIFRVNNAAVTTGFEQVKQKAAALRSNIVTQFAGAFAFGAVVASIKGVAAEFDRVQKLGIRFGESAESIQRVSLAASLAGADIERVAAAMGLATRNASEAGAGNVKMAAAFAELGIEADAFVNLPLEDKLVMLSEGLLQVEGDGDRLRLALEVLGRSGAEMLPLLLQGPEALRDTMEQARVATQAEIDKMAELNDRLEVLGQNVRTGLGEAFLWVVQRVEDAGSYIGAFLSVVMERIERAGGVLDRLMSGDFKGAAKAAAELVTSLPADLARVNEIATTEIVNRVVEREQVKVTSGKPASTGRSEDEAAMESAAAEAKGAQDAALEKEKTLLDLRATVARQEFEALSREERLAILRNEALNLMVDRGEEEEATLRRKIELNETAVEIAKLEKETAREKERAAEDAARREEDRMQEGFRQRQEALGFASGMGVGSIQQGLSGVNYSVINEQSQRQVELQVEMRDYLRKINEKKWEIDLPEAE